MNIINFILFQTAWFVTIFSAAYGNPYFGVLFTLVWVIFHFSFLTNKRNKELLIICITAVMAIAFELAQVLYGFISYPEQAALITMVPLWMITLWINLSLTINHSMAWLKGRYILAALFASVAGPLTYVAGERIGAITLHSNMSLLAISIMWLVSMPLIIWFASILYDENINKNQLAPN